jgi:cyclic pyranopterin phosphate synthase
MPEEDYVWLPRQELLTFEEIARLVEVFTSLGVTDVRLTGGEPLLRRDLPRLVEMLAANSAIRDLALTTNGILFAELAEALRAAGLHRATLSLDTLRPERFLALTRGLQPRTAFLESSKLIRLCCAAPMTTSSPP